MEKKTRILIRNFAIELIVYGVLVTIYFSLVLRLLNRPLTQLFANNLIAYGLIGLALTVVQAVLLDFVTSFLLDRLRLERLE
jgi:hypothetical protein